ncbi:fibronectin type III domain-containing protein [Candidatus Micrarchaeota archaeon]|nr:fibronectin type III domain-containing protein [Candidatus Micrarchaeota archaeon]
MGSGPVNLTDKGIYAAVRDKYGNNRDFGFYMQDHLLRVGDHIKFQQDFTIDEGGRWLIWPSYEIWKTAYSPVLKHDITMRIAGPSNWHMCEVAACPDYCEDDTHYHYDYIGQSGECVYAVENCAHGCNSEETDCANITRVEITQGPEVEDRSTGCDISAVVTWRQNIAGTGTLFYREEDSSEWMSTNSTYSNSTRHSVYASGIKPDKTYYYYIHACGPDDCTNSPDQVFSIPNKLSFTNVRSTTTERTANVTWETRCKREGESEIYWYRTETNYTLYVVPTAYAGFTNPPWSNVSNSSYGSNHTAALSGMLEEGRNYTFFISGCTNAWEIEDVICANSTRYTFLMVPRPFPDISNLAIRIQHESLEISWASFQTVNTTFYYKEEGNPETNYTKWRALTDPAAQVSHSFTLGGLDPGTKYYYKIEHCGSDGRCAVANITNQSFTTSSCYDHTKNGGETAVDVGGPCGPPPTCSDGIWNGNEKGADCGGNCTACSSACIPLVNNGPADQKINIVFVMDNDYRNDTTTFRADVRQLIEKGYYGNDLISTQRCKFNFYYVTEAGDAEDTCTRLDTPASLSTSCPFSNMVAIVHKTPFRDCSSGGVFSTESDGYNVVVHESGHSVFGLADEYCCDGGYWEDKTSFPNIFESESNCRAYAASNAYDPDYCYEFCPTVRCWPGGSAISSCQALFTSRGWSPLECDCDAFASANGLDPAQCTAISPGDCPIPWQATWQELGVDPAGLSVVSPHWCYARGGPATICCGNGWWKLDPDPANPLNPGNCIMKNGDGFGPTCQQRAGSVMHGLPACTLYEGG